MGKTADITKELDDIFNMNTESLAIFCDYNLININQRVEKDLQEVTDLIHTYDIVSLKR